MSAKDHLRKCAVAFTDSVNVSILIPHLISHDLITDPQRQALLLPNKTDYEKSLELLNFLLSNLSDAGDSSNDKLDSFKQCLQSTMRQHSGHEGLLRTLSRVAVGKAEDSGSLAVQHVFKIIMIGDMGVGKSSIVHKYCHDEFADNGSAFTIGVEFKYKTIQIGGNKIQLKIMDTAGQERFRTITQGYYRSADAAVVVFDVRNEDSFHSLLEWLADMNKYCKGNVYRVLVGNKTDCGDRTVPSETIQAFAKEHRLPYLETSAKTSSNINKLFQQIVEHLYSTRRATRSSSSDVITLQRQEYGEFTDAMEVFAQPHDTMPGSPRQRTHRHKCC